eukprot:1693812-Rhodomonas_salina.1
MDTTGKMRIRGMNGEYYATLITDDCSDNTDVIPHAKKSDVQACYQRRNVQQGITPKFLRTNGAGETNNPEFEQLLLSQGTHHEKSAADHQFQDGRVERK